MKIVSLTFIFCVAALFCQAQQTAPKPFLDIIKENKNQHKKIPFAIQLPKAFAATATTIILPNDHMPCFVPENSLTAIMPVLQTPLLQITTIPNAYRKAPAMPQ